MCVFVGFACRKKSGTFAVKVNYQILILRFFAHFAQCRGGLGAGNVKPFVVFRHLSQWIFVFVFRFVVIKRFVNKILIWVHLMATFNWLHGHCQIELLPFRYPLYSNFLWNSFRRFPLKREISTDLWGTILTHKSNYNLKSCWHKHVELCGILPFCHANVTIFDNFAVFGNCKR